MDKCRRSRPEGMVALLALLWYEETYFLIRHRCISHWDYSHTHNDHLSCYHPVKTLTDNLKLLHLNTMINALATNPDLAGISSSMRPQVLQTYYVCTGCDYISFFFVSIWKTSFLSTLFQYASFIAGGIDPPGSIGDIQPGHNHPAVFFFFCLVGCAYFWTHSSAFELQSPVALYHSVKQFTTVWDHHDK